MSQVTRLFLLLFFTFFGAASMSHAESTTSNYITAIVQFSLPAATTREQAKAMFEGSVPTYQDFPGLIRKYYLFGEGPIGGGVYLWESRPAAEKLYTKEWRETLKQRLGAEPSVTYYDTDVIVNNGH